MKSNRVNFLTKILVLLSVGGVGLSFFQAFRGFSLIFFINKFVNSKSQIGVLLSLGSLVGIFVPPLVGFLSDKLKKLIKGRKYLIIVSLFFLSLSIYFLEKTKNLSELYLYLTLTYIFFYSAISLYQALVPDLFSKDFFARATGVLNFASQFFQGIYIFIIVISHASNLTFTLLKWSIFLSSFLFFFIPEKENKRISQNFSMDMKFLRRKFWFNLFLLQFFVWYGISSVSSFILLFFQDVLSASLSDYMIILVIFGVLTALSTFFSGFVADKFAKEKLSAMSLALFGISSFLFSQTQRINMAFISSVFYGISLGFLTVIPYSLILSYIPKDKEGSIVGINALVVSVSQVIAYLTSGVMIDILGYRANFLQGLIATILGLLVLRNVTNNKKSS
ncbi:MULTISPECIES: MFS transporter [Dictyoglomus]|uniref:Major facilitator superfamily MFS_1 n=1 Tax=Dictyoglomus turgidum (strain DSM 6724 / Z-1310) TaxID=515635 RepID=B8E398_DICTD|nr:MULTISPECIES: MFS transporter [Dictyoglomus]ACK42972.1 major facilitator superfamily MFS_1 [Dictyoglomus turgidum DSM 6724]HBU31036.1 MFS transporter [Dictyoglomus sp.]